MHRRSAAVAMLTVMLVGFLVGCASGPTPSVKATSKPSAGPVRYASKSFAASLSVNVDPSLVMPPTEDSKGLLTWRQKGSDVNRIRFLVPAKYYAGENAYYKAPTDYLAYIKSLSSVGATFTNVGTVTVDGQTVPIMNVNLADGVDGNIGCAALTTPQTDTDHCFAFGPDYNIRVMVVKDKNLNFVAWARSSPDRIDSAFNAIFEKMVQSITFN
jgi:hypothetical protein